MPERDEDTGRYVEEYPPELFVDALSELDSAGGTQEIADEVGCKYDVAYKKLRALAEEGVITSRKVGNANLWMLVDGE
jgi:GTP-sensing pleiotropic transcriptional regulator CodY